MNSVTFVAIFLADIKNNFVDLVALLFSFVPLALKIYHCVFNDNA